MGNESDSQRITSQSITANRSKTTMIEEHEINWKYGKLQNFKSMFKKILFSMILGTIFYILFLYILWIGSNINF